MRSNKPTNFRLNLDSPLAYGLALWLPLSDGRLIDYVRGIVFTPSSTVPPMQPTLLGTAARKFTNASSTYLVSAITPVAAAPLTITCWFAPTISASTRDMVGIYNSGNTTDFFQLQSAGSASDTIRARTGDSGGASNGQSATGSTDNLWSLGSARFGATNNRVGQCDLGGTGTSTGSRTPTGLDRVCIGAQGSSSFSAYFDGWISDVCIWERSLSDAEIFKLYDPSTRWDLYEEIKRQWFVAAVLGGPTLYVNDYDGTLTSSGATSKRTSKSWAGTLTTAGVDAKRTSKPFGGTLTSSGALTALRVVLLALAGTLTTAGDLLKLTSKRPAGTLTSSGADAKLTSKSAAGTITPAGALAKRTAKAFAGAVTTAGSLAKRIGKALAGAITSAGALATEKITTPVASVFLTLPQRTRTFTLAAGRNTLTLAKRSRAYTLAAGRNTLTLANRVIRFTLQDK